MLGFLSYDDAPPFAAPVRFFLFAPLHGVLAACLMLWLGPELFASRWAPEVLALTHLLTLGFLMQTMLGALFQVLPVVAGVSIAQPLIRARWIHAGLNVGTLLLCGGFLTGKVGLLHAAASLIALSLGAFLWSVGRPLLGRAHTSPTIPAIKLAWLGLACTVLFGLAALAVYGFGVSGRTDVLTSQHVAWAFVGFSATLLVGVSYVVVPMFQLTPGYQASLTRVQAPILAAGVGAWMLAMWADNQAGARAAAVLMAGSLASFALSTLLLQRKSKRPRHDTTFNLWRLGMLTALVACLAWLLILFGVLHSDNGADSIGLAGLVILGVFVPVISGMLHKIMPFLAWLNLQRFGMARGIRKTPGMHEFARESWLKVQYWAHLVSLGGFVLALFWSPGIYLSALALALAFAMMGGNHLLTLRRYLAHKATLSAAAICKNSGSMPVEAGRGA